MYPDFALLPKMGKAGREEHQVATTNKDIYSGRDSRDVPTYGIKDAARFLIIPSDSGQVTL
jgi:hypothetical protein